MSTPYVGMIYKAQTRSGRILWLTEQPWCNDMEELRLIGVHSLPIDSDQQFGLFAYTDDPHRDAAEQLYGLGRPIVGRMSSKQSNFRR